MTIRKLSKGISYFNIILLSFASFTWLSCHHNTITGRRQLSLMPESVLQQQSLTQYRKFLSTSSVVRQSSGNEAELVNRVGRKIADAIKRYYNRKGNSRELDGYNWEFNVVNSSEVNAWCMPGGKVVVYTGLLPYTQNENALAVVMGHEITHAVAHHGNERMSQALLAQGMQVAGNVFTQDNDRANKIFNGVFAPGAQVGFLLPNSRNQEFEADHYGLIFAAMAGYDPREAVNFWKRMSAAGGKKPPEFLATHPSDEKRIANIQKHMDEALSYYKP